MKINFDDLVDQKLVIKRDVGNGMSLYKYSRKVMFDNLWLTDPRLKFARGIITLNDTDEVVVMPFIKTFNYGEVDMTINDDEMVIVPRKVNGFMFAVTKDVNGSIIFSNTGSVGTKYSDYGQSYFNEYQLKQLLPNMTYLFEVCHPEDPHIIPEKPGLYLIGACKTDQEDIDDVYYESEAMLDQYAKAIGVRRPDWNIMKFKDIDMSVLHEGYMIRDLHGNYISKMKTPYYLAKKFVMRKKFEKILGAYRNPRKNFFDPKYHYILKFIQSNEIFWTHLDEVAKGLIFDQVMNTHVPTLADEPVLINDKKVPMLYIVRGIPGSGKTTLAQAMARAMGCVYVEADQYMTDDQGIYEWDVEKLPWAHQKCKHVIKIELQSGSDVIVSNVSATLKDINEYIEIAKSLNCNFTSLVVESRNETKSTHNLPAERILTIRRQFVVKI